MEGPDATSNPVACFKHGHVTTPSDESLRGGEAGDASANNDDVVALQACTLTNQTDDEFHRELSQVRDRLRAFTQPAFRAWDGDCGFIATPAAAMASNLGRCNLSRNATYLRRGLSRAGTAPP